MKITISSNHVNSRILEKRVRMIIVIGEVKDLLGQKNYFLKKYPTFVLKEQLSPENL